MASWLKVAEDLFEVVDRRAKFVVSELSDEQQSESHSSASKGQEIKGRSSNSKGKGQLRSSGVDLLSQKTTVQDQTTDGTSLHHVETENNQILQYNKPVEIINYATTEASEESSHGIIANEIPVVLHRDVVAVDPITRSAESSDTAIEDNSDLSFSQPSIDQIEIASVYQPPVGAAESTPVKSDASQSIGDNSVEVEGSKVNSSDIVEGNNLEPLHPPSPTTSKPNKHVNETSLMKVQDQLDEAQGLLKTTVSTGQSKEARLARVCAGLSSRLQEYKSENAQLEELLVAERELNISYQTQIKHLQKELSTCRNEAAATELRITEALGAKNVEIEALVSSMDALKKHAAASEGKLSDLQEDMETMMRSRELTETRMLQALREELRAAERQAEEERLAHNATKMAAMEREVELEHRAVEASNALARMQRTTEESTSRATDLEHKIALLEVECASLNQELQELEARTRRGQKKSSEEANQHLQMQAWQEEVERARQGQRDAENKLSSLETELQKLRVEMAGMRRDAEHYSRHEHMELEKRYRELTDLLYHKQTQLETMASEKAAAEFQLEKEIMHHQEAQEAEKSRASRRASSPWEEDADPKPLESLPLHHRHMVGASIHLEKAVKLLDSGAVRATRFLWRYPYARVILLFYLVFVHLFLMYLLHRLQEQADNLSAREVAASMGLNNSVLQ